MDCWFTRGLSFLPIFLIIWTYLTFMTSYLISVSRGDVDPGFPYISDTGARKPESSVFGQMLNICAAVAFACLYVRYKQVESFLIKLPEEKIHSTKRWNTISLYLGVLICLGLSMVANFQETSVLSMHILGAMMTFLIGSIYEFIHSYISYRMHPEVNSLCVAHIRLVIAFLSTTFLITSSVAEAFVKDPVKFHWAPEDEGYAAHLTSTIAEWLLAASFLSYFFTFIRDFQVITIDATPNNLRDSLHHSHDEPLSTQFRPEERTPLIA